MVGGGDTRIPTSWTNRFFYNVVALPCECYRAFSSCDQPEVTILMHIAQLCENSSTTKVQYSYVFILYYKSHTFIRKKSGESNKTVQNNKKYN